jgi:hypothetical protein
MEMPVTARKTSEPEIREVRRRSRGLVNNPGLR